MEANKLIVNGQTIDIKSDIDDGSITKAKLASAVQTSLDKADSALQEHQSLAAYRTSAAQDVIDNGKQSTISDLETIRSGASAGATAVQPAAIANFITKAVSDLENYYLKTETYTQAQVNSLIGAINQFKFEIYSTLPASGNSSVLYLIGPTGTGTDKYEEYVYANSQFTKIGDTSIDLSGYVTTTALNTALSAYRTSAAQDTIDATKLSKATPTTEQGTKEYLYSFAGQTQNTDIAVINDMSSGSESYTDKMVPTAKSVATALESKQSLVTGTHTDEIAVLDSDGKVTYSGKTVEGFERADDTMDSAITGLLNPQTPSGLPLMAGQPSILFGSDTPQESVVPDNWNQYDPDTDTGHNWNGLPSVLGQQYINTAGGTSGRYIGVKNGEYGLKWQNC